MKNLEVKGARQHNLRNISVTIPRDKLTVITGVSGSGKSTLAFDTIYAEGQRRYVESLSAYARQFLGQMRKPDVDSIDGLSPSIAIEQKTTSKNPRSTVGTVTEIYDYLRLLFSRIGVPYCPKHHVRIEARSPAQIADAVMKDFSGMVTVLAPVVRKKKGTYEQLFRDLNADGFTRVRVDGEICRTDDEIKLGRYIMHNIDIVIDRCDAADRSRINEAVEKALQHAEDGLVYVSSGGDTKDAVYSAKMACPVCGMSFEELQPRMFSFNSPFGACPTCNGLGFQMIFDPDLIIPDKSDFTYIVLTAVYAFSPYYLGMVNYYSLDYYLICLFPIVVYYAFAEKWMQMTLTAIFFCFTKEPAIIIYGALCVGMVIRDVIIFLEEKKDEKMTMLSVLKKVFGTVHYYYMALPGLLWIFILVIIGLWVGGSHDVGVNADYIIGRVKALYVLNFSWIFVVIIAVILASRIIIKKRSSSTIKITLPIICNLVAFTAFNFVFITVNQPRYVDSIAYSLYLLAAVLCGSICKEKVVKIVAPVIAILMLIQCFTTIDPLTRVSFDNINTGDGMVVSGMSRIGDASVYNKQMLWAEYPLRCAIKDALNDDSTIVYTAFCATTHSTDGMSEVAVVREDLWEETMYYDMEANRRLPDNSTEVEEISVYHASENARLNELGDVGTRISLIYSDIDSSQDVDMLTNQLDIESVGEYTYRGWVFHRVVGTVK